MKKLFIFITFIFLVGDARAQAGATACRVINSPTIITSGVSSTSTVFTKPLEAPPIFGNTTGQTNPSLAFSVPSGQFCEFVFSFIGESNSQADFPTMRLVFSSTSVLYLGTSVQNVTANYRVNAISNPIKLGAGSYTYSTESGFRTGSASAAYYGYCFYK